MKTLSVFFRTSFVLFLFLSIICIQSCSDDDKTESKTPVVYAAGRESNAAGVQIAKYWKDGEAFVLGNGQKDSEAGSIFVSGNDIYVAGQEGNVATYWKNGVAVTLPDGDYASSIFVSGSDVYITGLNGNKAKYWKNSQSIDLTDGTTQSGGSVIMLNGSDVYVCGYEDNKARYWKNGVGVWLSQEMSYAHGIVVSGTDVYTAGEEFLDTDVSLYWKNGVRNAVTKNDNTESSWTSGIALSGTDVFMSGVFVINNGKTRPAAVYWKNGDITTLTDGTSSAYGNCLFVKGSDIYVGGSERTAGDKIPVAKYWKNGVATSLTDGTQSALVIGIFVK